MPVLPGLDAGVGAAFVNVDTLGFELQRDDDSVPGIRWIQVAPKGDTTSLTLVNWFESMPPRSLQGLVLKSGDLQMDYEALTAAGAQFDGPPQHQPWATEVVLHDPDGNSADLAFVEEPDRYRAVLDDFLTAVGSGPFALG